MLTPDPFFYPLYPFSVQWLFSGSCSVYEYVALSIQVWSKAQESITTRYPEHIVYLPLISIFLDTHASLLSSREPSHIFVRCAAAVITSAIFFDAVLVLPHFARTSLLVLNLFCSCSFFFHAALVLSHPASTLFPVVVGSASLATLSLALFLLLISEFVLCFALSVIRLLILFSKIPFDMFTKIFPFFPVVVYLILLPRTTLSLLITLFPEYLVIPAVVIIAVHLLWPMVTRPLFTLVHLGTSSVSPLSIFLTRFT